MKAFILNIEKKEYEKELKKLGLDVTEEIEESTDLFIFGNELPHLQVDTMGKRLHILEKNMLPSDYGYLVEQLLQGGKEE